MSMTDHLEPEDGPYVRSDDVSFQRFSDDSPP
jgi:hypothetical protein